MSDTVAPFASNTPTLPSPIEGEGETRQTHGHDR